MDETWEAQVSRLRAEIAVLQAHLNRLLAQGVRTGEMTPWYERHELKSVLHGIE